MHIVMAIAMVEVVVQMESKLLLFFAFSLQAAVITTSSEEEFKPLLSPLLPLPSLGLELSSCPHRPLLSSAK